MPRHGGDVNAVERYPPGVNLDQRPTTLTPSGSTGVFAK